MYRFHIVFSKGTEERERNIRCHCFGCRDDRAPPHARFAEERRAPVHLRAELGVGPASPVLNQCRILRQVARRPVHEMFDAYRSVHPHSSRHPPTGQRRVPPT